MIKSLSRSSIHNQNTPFWGIKDPLVVTTYSRCFVGVLLEENRTILERKLLSSLFVLYLKDKSLIILNFTLESRLRRQFIALF